MSDSDVVTAPAVVEDHAPGARQPGFQELMERIEAAVADFKRRQKAVESIRESLNKARKEESDCLQRSLSDDDPKLVRRIAESRVAIEVNSRRLTVGEESLLGGLEPIAELIRQLQAWLIERLSDLSAERTRAHHEAIARELDLDALDRFFIQHGLRRDALWTIASLAPDVLILQQFFPYLTWVGPNLERTLPKLETDIEALFKAVRAFEAHVDSVQLES